IPPPRAPPPGAEGAAAPAPRGAQLDPPPPPHHCGAAGRAKTMAIAALRAVTKSGRNIGSILWFAAGRRHVAGWAGSHDTVTLSAKSQQATRQEIELCSHVAPGPVDG